MLGRFIARTGILSWIRFADALATIEGVGRARVPVQHAAGLVEERGHRCPILSEIAPTQLQGAI